MSEPAAGQTQQAITPGNVLHSALLLLGFPDGSQATMLSTSMFDKTNSKAFEAILHFLLGKLKGATQAKKDFKDLWPIKDARQQKDFRKVVHSMLIELEHKEKLPRRLVAAVPSMFATAAGQRVVELLCFLACHALGQQLQQHFPSELQHVQVQHGQVQDTPANSAMLEAATLVAQAHGAIQQKQFLQNAAAYASLQEQWQSSADQLSACFHSLQQEQQSVRDALAQTQGPTLSAAEQQEQLELAQHLWTDLLDHLASLQGLQKLVNSVIDSNSHPHAVDGQNLQRIKTAITHPSTDAGALQHAPTRIPPVAGIDIVQLLEELTAAVASYSQPLGDLAGSSGSTAMCELALPAGQGGHQSHLAAALAAQQQHCNQQKQLHAALQTDLTAIGAYKKALIQQVAAGMKAKDARSHSDQENLIPDAKHDGCQGVVLQLAPPTPVGRAPMHAAAMSVAAKGQHQLAGSWAAPIPTEGKTVMKHKVQQAAKMHERSWTPLGVRMPANAALPPSSARGGLMASTIKRARNPLSCITEEGANLWSDSAAPRRLSYSSPSEQQDATSAGVIQEVETPVVAAMPFRPQTAQSEAPLSVAALMARMHKLRHMG